jgi:uncharacterized protein
MHNRNIILLTSLLAGLTFGLGLILSGMVNPDKVISFLDVTDAWDPSLAFVMVGAIAIAALGFRIMKKRRLSLLAQEIQLPSKPELDQQLILGSLGFGIGWGLAGICPGPALVLLGTANLKGLVFVIFMLLGMGVFELLTDSKKH